MANSVAPDETAVMSCLIWIYIVSTVFVWICWVERIGRDFVRLSLLTMTNPGLDWTGQAGWVFYVRQPILQGTEFLIKGDCKKEKEKEKKSILDCTLKMLEY